MTNPWSGDALLAQVARQANTPHRPKPPKFDGKTPMESVCMICGGKIKVKSLYLGFDGASKLTWKHV